MAKFSLRRYDTQARVSVVVSAISLAGTLVLAVLLLRNLHWAEKTIVYGNATFRTIVLITATVAVLLSAIGLGLGFNSAGQRRNDKPALSWIGFFVGAGILCLTMIMVFIFQIRGEYVGP